MNQGWSDMLALAFDAAFAMTATYAVIRWDRQRTDTFRVRDWNSATTAVAVFFFAPLSVAVYFAVTRRSWKGLASGLFALACIAGVQALFHAALVTLVNG